MLSCSLLVAVLALAGKSHAWTVTTMHWNIHYGCGQSSHSCAAAGAKNLASFAHSVNADIVVGIELHGACAAFHGWHHTAEYKDAVSLCVKSSWQVHKTGGGQIVSGSGARGLAVALVTPPHKVHGCPKLCIMGAHPGHSHISAGKSIVHGVCGKSVAEKCSIAMGDWNAPASFVKSSHWPNLIGGHASVVAPSEDTCCWNDHGRKITHNFFDHAGTNIAGAHEAGHKVWDYQMKDHYPMKEEHKPVAVHISLPSSAADLANWTNESATADDVTDWTNESAIIV